MRMKIENGKRVRNKRNSFIPTIVKGVRAEPEFFELVDERANAESTSRNELIVRVMTKYCEREELR